MASINSQNKIKPPFSLIVRALLATIVIFAVIFITAGRIDYWQGWIYTLLTCLIFLITYFVIKDNPELMTERLRPGVGIKWWDKIYFPLSTSFGFLTIILAALDTGRFGWSKSVNWSSYLAGYVLFITGHAIFLWAKRTNPFFSSVVRIQSERDHQVCDAGLYQHIRHPGYAGAILFGVTTPVIMGSTWGVLPAVLAAILLVIRTKQEDEMLQNELPGYREYAQKVKYRLISGIW